MRAHHPPFARSPSPRLACAPPPPLGEGMLALLALARAADEPTACDIERVRARVWRALGWDAPSAPVLRIVSLGSGRDDARLPPQTRRSPREPARFPSTPITRKAPTKETS